MKVSRALLLASLLMTISCTDDDGGKDGDDPALLGEWSASQSIPDPVSGGNASVSYEIAIREDSRAALDLYWNQLYSKGFSGSWALKGDSLVLDADVCYKGDGAGNRSVNHCSEDFRFGSLSMGWDGKNLKSGPASDPIVFSKDM